MEVTRIFHPVGQGGFYTESFDDQHMVVYDCGGKSREFMEEYIDSFLPENPQQQIDAIFISHLHRDHINGLEYLLNKVRGAKNLYIPFLTKNRLFEAAIYNHQFSHNDEVNKFIELIVFDGLLSDTTIVEVSENGEDGDGTKSMVIGEHSVIRSGDNIHIDEPQSPLWVYIPYCSATQSPNFPSDLAGDKFLRKLEEIYNTYDGQDLYFVLMNFLKKRSIKEIVRLYKILYGGVHNSQSMTVFSGLRIKDREYFDIISQSNLLRNACNKSYWHCHHRMCDCMCHIDCEEKVPCNFLYMGDFESKVEKNFKALKLFYTRQDVWDTLCGIQIPHHGSRDNYNKGLYDDKCFAIASAGIKNQNNHPHIDTLINIVNQGCCPNVVTEDINTLKYQHFNIK